MWWCVFVWFVVVVDVVVEGVACCEYCCGRSVLLLIVLLRLVLLLLLLGAVCCVLFVDCWLLSGVHCVLYVLFVCACVCSSDEVWEVIACLRVCVYVVDCCFYYCVLLCCCCCAYVLSHNASLNRFASVGLSNKIVIRQQQLRLWTTAPIETQAMPDCANHPKYMQMWYNCIHMYIITYINVDSRDIDHTV